MSLFKIHIYKLPASTVTIWKEKATAKGAYEYGIELGTEIFGNPPASVVIEEEKPVV